MQSDQQRDQCISSVATGAGQATSVVGNAGREIQYGLHITF